MKPKIEEKKPKKPAMEFDIGTVLVIGAAAFQAYQFGRALFVYDPAGWSVYEVSIGGLILGAIVNVIVVLAATRLPELTAAAIKTKGKVDKKKKAASERREQKAGVQARFAQAAFFGLMALSPSLVAPAMYISWKALPLPPQLIIALAIGWAIAPDGAIALGGFIAGKSLLHLSDAPASARGASARTFSDSAPQSDARPKKSIAPAMDSANSAMESNALRRTYPRRCDYCTSDSPIGLLKSAQSVGGHMKKHHPELCKPNVLAEQLFKAEVKE